MRIAFHLLVEISQTRTTSPFQVAATEVTICIWAWIFMPCLCTFACQVNCFHSLPSISLSLFPSISIYSTSLTLGPHSMHLAVWAMLPLNSASSYPPGRIQVVYLGKCDGDGSCVKNVCLCSHFIWTWACLFANLKCQNDGKYGVCLAAQLGTDDAAGFDCSLCSVCKKWGPCPSAVANGKWAMTLDLSVWYRKVCKQMYNFSITNVIFDWVVSHPYLISTWDETLRH